MMKLQTAVECGKSPEPFSPEDRIMVIGSCFADNMGARMMHSGLNVCVNPFGTLYNPLSILDAIQRLNSAKPFTQEDCVQMGAGADLWCSFSHHSSHARKTREEFLADANSDLEKVADFWKDCNRLIVTLGTAWTFFLAGSDRAVSNCLKRPSKEFTRRLIDSSECREALEMISALAGERRLLFTVSPIRHMADGAHGNALSKARLLLAADEVVNGKNSDRSALREYFPAYEIILDELRDYRFYAEDMVHPSSQAEDYIWERFREWAFAPRDIEKLLENERQYRRSLHRPLH